MTYKINKLEKRILELSYKHQLSHLNSCLTSVNIIDKIYKKKGKNDIFILSNGHAGLSLYVVLEKYYKLDAEKLFLKHGVHPSRDLNNKIYCSTGSLGNGVGIGIGAAIANKDKNIHILLSDGEMMEGSCWECLRIAKENNLKNLFLYLNANGLGAYRSIDLKQLKKQIKSFGFSVKIFHTNMNKFKNLKGLQGHYKILSQFKYEKYYKT